MVALSAAPSIEKRDEAVGERSGGRKDGNRGEKMAKLVSECSSADDDAAASVAAVGGGRPTHGCEAAICI